MGEYLLYAVVAVVPCAVALLAMVCLRYVPKRWRHVDVGVKTPLFGVEMSARDDDSEGPK